MNYSLMISSLIYVVVSIFSFYIYEKKISIYKLIVIGSPLLVTLLFLDFNTVLEANFYTAIDSLNDSSIFLNDLYMNSTERYGGYTFFNSVMSVIPRNIILETFFIIWLLCFLGFILLGFKFFNLGLESETKKAIFAFIFSFLLVVTVRNDYLSGYWGGITLGDNDLLYNMLRHNTISFLFGIASIYTFINSRYYFTGLLLGLSINFHINVGQQVASVLFLFYLFDFKTVKLSDFSKIVILSFVLSAVTILPVVYGEFYGLKTSFNPHESEFLFLSGYLRHPHHMIPAAWSFKAYALYLSGSLLLCLLSCTFSLKYRKYYILISLCGLLLILINYFGVEVLESNFICKLQLSRFTVIVKYFLLAVVSLLLANMHRYRLNVVVSILVLIFLVVRFTQTKNEVNLSFPEATGYELFIAQTDKDTVILHPPYWGHKKSNSLLWNTKRSSYLDLRYPFSKGFGTEWGRRLFLSWNYTEYSGSIVDIKKDDILKFKLENNLVRNYYSKHDVSSICKMKDYPKMLLILDRSVPKLAELPRVYESGNVSLIDMKFCDKFE